MTLPPIPSPALDVHVVSHTHWDREWYRPLGRFRPRLVALIDELLDSTAADESFLLDGQAIVLEDYLAVRPERRDDVAARLRGGAMEAGPWYVLADELIPGGEALVRNLLAGRSILRSLGAEPPPVLYSPDAFGHTAALPTIARGFGCAVAVVWRGFGGARFRAPGGDTYRWRAPDGAEVLLFHLPRDGYELGASLPADGAAASARWAHIRAELAPRSRFDVLLVQNGADHHALQRNPREAIAALAAAALPDRVQRSTLRAFAAALHRRGKGKKPPLVEGELRDSYGYAWTLQGTFATRAYQKRRNAHAEHLLVRDVEPWLAVTLGRDGSADRRRVALLSAAWRTVLQCHPHDTLCGCSVDEVARAMDGRLEDARAQSRELRRDAIDAVIGHDRSAAREARHAWRPTLLLRNPAARPRGGVAEIGLSVFLRNAPIGPGSARLHATGERGATMPFAWHDVTLGAGDIPLQVLSTAERDERTESPRHYPINDRVAVARALAWIAEPIAGFGTRGLALSATGAGGKAVSGPVAVTVAAPGETPAWIDNGVLRFEVDASGATRLHHRAAGRVISAVIAFESVTDRGDLYTHSPVGEPTRASFLSARVVHHGPLRGELRLTWTLALAKRANGGGRRGRKVRTVVRANVSLDAASDTLRIFLTGRNRARDHRLRVLIATGVEGHGVPVADAALGWVQRPPLVVPDDDARAEQPPPTAPLHRHVTISSASAGASLISDGLAEYEILDGGVVAVTLVRAVGELSRNDLPERPGHAGWPVPTPGAQCRRRFAAVVGLLPHRGGAATAPEIRILVERAAEDLLLPVRGATLRSAITAHDATFGAELGGEGLAFSALKPAEASDAIVARCINLTDQPVAGSWRFGRSVLSAHDARLDETPLDTTEFRDDTVSFVAGPRAVVTTMVRLAR